MLSVKSAKGFYFDMVSDHSSGLWGAADNTFIFFLGLTLNEYTSD